MPDMGEDVTADEVLQDDVDESQNKEIVVDSKLVNLTEDEDERA